MYRQPIIGTSFDSLTRNYVFQTKLIIGIKCVPNNFVRVAFEFVIYIHIYLYVYKYIYQSKE